MIAERSGASGVSPSHPYHPLSLWPVMLAEVVTPVDVVRREGAETEARRVESGMEQPSQDLLARCHPQRNEGRGILRSCV